ncbi:MAG: 2-dehydropantoate 2-reductase N-terminal domain-containing protein, partial [Paracoccaceae bacterium]
MEIAVLGGGNGSIAAAADLTLNGHIVKYWRRDQKKIKELKAANNIIHLKDFNGVKEVKIPTVTSDIAKVIKGVDLIVCPIPATGQSDLAKIVVPFLENNQVVLLPPGSFGSWLFAKTQHHIKTNINVCYAESGTLPYLARLNGPNTIAITTRATRLP